MTVNQHTQADGQLHVIIYNASGKTLPVGETVLGNLADGSSVSHAMLVDEEARSVSVSLNDPEAQLVTGVENREQKTENNSEIYDLSGRRINSETLDSRLQTLDKGIYIVNGKKVIIK